MGPSAIWGQARQGRALPRGQSCSHPGPDGSGAAAHGGREAGTPSPSPTPPPPPHPSISQSLAHFRAFRDSIRSTTVAPGRGFPGGRRLTYRSLQGISRTALCGRNGHSRFSVEETEAQRGTRPHPRAKPASVRGTLHLPPLYVEAEMQSPVGPRRLTPQAAGALIRLPPQPAPLLGAHCPRTSPGRRRGLLTARNGEDLKEEGAIQGFANTLSSRTPFQVLRDPEAYLKQIKMGLPSLIVVMISPEPLTSLPCRWNNEAPKVDLRPHPKSH